MATNADRKERPISVRLPEADIAMIGRAADRTKPPPSSPSAPFGAFRRQR